MRCCFGGLFIQWEQPVMCVCHILSFALAYIVHSILKGAPSARRLDCAKSCLIFLFFFLFSFSAGSTLLPASGVHSCIVAARTLLQQTWMADCVSVSSFVAYLGFLARYWHVGLTAFDSPMSLRPNHVERICYRSVGWLGGRVLGLATVATGHHHDDACFIGQRNFIYACCSINTIQGSQCNKMHFCCVCVWECKCNTHTGLHILHIHYIEDEWSAV